MKRLFAAPVIAVVLAGSAACALEPLSAMQGKVLGVDPAGKSVILVGGATFTVQPNVSIEPLRPGQQVTIMYQNGADGQKELSAFRIDTGLGGEKN
jgi:hypothetical protein